MFFLQCFVLAPVVEGDSSGRLLLTEEGWWLHLGVAEAQVLVEVVQAVDKVTDMTTQHLEPGGRRVNDLLHFFIKHINQTLVCLICSTTFISTLTKSNPYQRTRYFQMRHLHSP